MRMPYGLLRVAIQFACIFSVAADYDGDSPAHGILRKSMGEFQLTGEANPTMREVNGGRLCVNGFGKKPPGYYFSGDVSLEECAAIAHEQPSPLGFRWGRPGFDYAVYNAYAKPESQGGNETIPVDLGLLFPQTGDFLCTIFVALDSRGQPLTFKKSNTSERFKPKLKDGPASSVCFQRWTMTEFFKPVVEELWFCYMPQTGVQHCQDVANTFYFQGKIFICVFIFFLGVLGWIMSDMPEFETPLVWFTRLLLNLELGMVSVAFLLERWYDIESPTFFLAAFFLDIIGGVALFCPYYIMERISEDSPFNTAYLLLLAFSPCFLMEIISYWSHFILLVGHLPLLIGFLAFISTALAIRYWNFVREARELSDEGIARMASLNKIDKASYVSVPTDEPADCGCHRMSDT